MQTVIFSTSVLIGSFKETPSSGHYVHRAKRIASDWQSEVQNITQSFVNSGYPPKFVHDTIKEIENREADELIIPVHWFDEKTDVGCWDKITFLPQE